MKKYTRVKCSVCHRVTDKITRTEHAQPDLCTITLGCTGRLQLVEYLSRAEIAQTVVSGVPDWRPRNAAEFVPPTTVPFELIAMANGAAGEIVLASDRDIPEIIMELTGKVEAPRDYRAFMYRITGEFRTVSGVEAGLERKTLRFGAQDSVTVMVNGVPRQQGTGADEYQISRPDNTLPGNTIIFNEPVVLPGTVQVDVVVTKTVTPTVYRIVFRRNIPDETLPASAWVNVDSITGMWNGNTTGVKYLYTARTTDLNIPANILLQPQASDDILLLSRAPFSYLDRYLTMYVSCRGFSDENQYIRYSATLDGRGVPVSANLTVTNNTITQTYPVMICKTFKRELPITTALPGDPNQIVMDGSVIIGPDT